MGWGRKHVALRSDGQEKSRRPPEFRSQPAERATPYNGPVNSPVQAIDDWARAHKDLILSETQAVLRIPSVKDDATVGPGAPFGRACADALEHTLALCKRLGMRTQNFGGYAGHAEFGPEDAPEYVAMLGHLDVVPPGDDWTRDPWGGVIDDGWLWSRGASDDKGPTFAALFGAKAVLDSGVPLTRRIRLIFGCDEESGWECMAHYFGDAGQPMPALGFTPDAGFPLYHAEKGSFTAVVEKVVAGGRVVAFESGLRPNMVPDRAHATLRGSEGAAALRKKRLTVEKTGDELSVSAVGKSAHGASPQKGLNAGAKLARALASVCDDPWLAQIASLVAPDGSGVGIAGRDDITGALTCNLGVLRQAGNVVRLTFNVRYPATWNSEATLARFRESVEGQGWALVDMHHTAPLYVPLDQEPVKTLLRVYRERTGDRSRPKTMGGRTYATTIQPVGVAYGAARKGDPDVAHRPDERFAVARLLECVPLYGQALYELAR